MEKYLIIHGKPSDTETTAGECCEGLGKRICTEFFDSVSSIPKPSMVVKVRRWKDKFYCIYTYSRENRGKNDRRGCYCAISLIFHNFICSKTSYVFNFLKSIYDDDICDELRYIDNSGRYQVYSLFTEEDKLKEIIEKNTANIDESLFAPLSPTEYKVIGIGV